MKANKALKRLTKIESLMSVVTERYSASAPHLRAMLQGAKDAVARAKQAVSLQLSSGIKTATAKRDRAAKKAKPSQKRAAINKAAGHSPRAKTAKKPVPIKKSVKKRAAKKTASDAVVQAPITAG